MVARSVMIWQHSNPHTGRLGSQCRANRRLVDGALKKGRLRAIGHDRAD